jgi:ferredoxin
MPSVAFDGNELGPPVTASIESGGPLIDICDDARAPVSFSCRSASCGTCRVDVLEGADLFLPPGRDEREVLDLFDARPTHRLACQAVVRPGPGLIRLRWVSD